MYWVLVKMKIVIDKKLTCGKEVKELQQCSDAIREKLENKFNCKLMFTRKEDGTFTESNGSITIDHRDGEHKIILDFWDKTEKANDIHTEPRKKLAIIPSESEIKKAI